MNPAIDLTAAKRVLLWSAVVLPALALSATVAADGWPARRFLAFYVAPLFMAAPLWVRLRIERRWPAFDFALLLDGVVLLLSFLRFVVGEWLPFSGHMLFLTYSGLTTPHRGYRLLAALLAAETTIFKLWIWRDPSSWTLGLALGLLAAFGRSFARRLPSL